MRQVPAPETYRPAGEPCNCYKNSMLPNSFTNVHGFRKTLVLSGIVLLLISLLLFAGGLLGFYSLQAVVVAGQSSLKTIASLAVAGCLAAAIGYGNQ